MSNGNNFKISVNIRCDKDGIIWSGEITPFLVEIICLNSKNAEIKNKADKLYEDLTNSGIDVLYDEREDISPGVKFKDADLIGIPIQLIISEKNTKNNEIEVKIRRTGERLKATEDNILKTVIDLSKNTN